MPPSSHAGPSPAVVEAAAGLSAGILSTLVVHPLDIVKTRMQIYRPSNASSSSPPSTFALLRSLTMDKAHPLAALYRGLTPNLVGNAASWASFFFFKSRLEDALVSSRHRPHPSTADHFLAGALAGAATTVLTNPLWVLKTRMLSSDRQAAGAYPSMLAGARSIYHSEGIHGFYRGLTISLLGISHGAVQFAVYEPAKRFYFATRQEARPLQDGPISPQATVALSGFSKLVAGLATYPYQVLRSRMQSYHADERFGRGIAQTVATIWREDGFVGFYRGLVPGILRVMPATWITFLVYEQVNYYLPRLIS